MTKSKISLSANWKWLLLFGCWSLFLTGFFANFVGSPGILQAVRLDNLLQTKREQLSQLEQELKRLRQEVVQLETNRFAQEKEVRRVLGYAANNELIFDFSSMDTL